MEMKEDKVGYIVNQISTDRHFFSFCEALAKSDQFYIVQAYLTHTGMFFIIYIYICILLYLVHI